VNLRRAFETALWAVRAYPGSTALLAGASAITVGVTLPNLFLGAGRLSLPAAPDPALPIGLSAFAGTPATMQAQGIDAIASVLVALGVAALGVGVVTAGSLAAGRAAGRRPEIAVRRAVGAARAGLRLSGLVEGLLLALGALGIGMVPAVVAVRWAVAQWLGTLIPALAGAVAAMGAIALTLFLGALAGVRAPGGTRVPHRGASSHGLVIPAFQFAVSLAILTGAARTGARAGQLLHSSSAEPRAAATVVQIDGDSALASRAVRYQALVRALRADRRLDLVSLSSAGALVGMGPVDFVTTDCGQCVEGMIYTPFRPVPATITAVSADTFRAIGLPVVAGRGLADTDSWSSRRVAVISATLAARDFRDGRAVGRNILVGRGEQSGWYQVVGVVPDRIADGIGGALAPRKAVYLSALQTPPAHVDLLVRGSGTPAAALLASAGRVAGVTSLSALRSRETRVLVWFGDLARGAGWAVLFIAVAGMFAVMERWVAAVGPELAVRRAVGARRIHVLLFVLARALGVAAVGAAAGFVISIFISGALEDAFPGLPAWSWPAVLAVGVALLGATAVGALVPGWSVIRAAPATKLAELEG
jgi:putative ABC transport system permease protein